MPCHVPRPLSPVTAPVLCVIAATAPFPRPLALRLGSARLVWARPGWSGPVPAWARARWLRQ